MRLTLLLAPALLLAGCTFVEMAPGGSAVRVATPGPALGCEKRGEIVVSVKDRLGPLERDALKVRDELEVLARNEAPGLGADTVQAMGPVQDGEQRFAAYRCGGPQPQARAANAQRVGETTVEELPEDRAETLPLRND
jgi:hypothetical protein